VDVVHKVIEQPISSWSYKAEALSTRHLGPVAQDFYAAFGFGEDDKHITTVDEGGATLAAIRDLMSSWKKRWADFSLGRGGILLRKLIAKQVASAREWDGELRPSRSRLKRSRRP